MNLRETFTKEALERGRLAFSQGRVTNLVQKGRQFTALVRDASVYQTTVEFSLAGGLNLYCTCPEAAGGGHCCHEAAVLFAVQARQKDRPRRSAAVARQEVDPFPEEDGEYRYFNIRKMTENLVFYDTVVRKAKQLLAEDVVRLGNVELGYRPFPQEASAVVTATGGILKDRQFRSVELEFDRERILSIRCDIPQCGFEYNPEEKNVACEHVTAILLLLERYIRENNPGDITDRNGMYLLDNYRDRHISDVRAKDYADAAPIRLEAHLEEDAAGWYAAFKVGTDRLYVVRRLSALVEKAEQKGVYPLGKKLELHFGANTFDEESWQVYRFLRRVVREEQERLGIHMGEELSDTLKDRIRLYGSRLDEFFSLFEGKELTVGTGRRMRQVRLEDGRPQVSLKVSPEADEDGTFHGLTIKGTLPRLQEGIRSVYCLEEDRLLRIDAEYSGELRPLMEMAQGASIAFRVGRNNLSEFYYRVLPHLQGWFTVTEEEPEQIEASLPPEPTFRFWLDAEQNRLICRTAVHYGELECSVLDVIDPNARLASYRDRTREEETAEIVRSYFPKVDRGRDAFVCSSEDGAYHILEDGIGELMELGEVNSTERFSRLKIRRRARVTMGVSVQSDMMDLTILSEDLPQDELLDILRSYREKKKYHRLRSGDFLRLENNGLEELAMMTEAFRLNPGEFSQGSMRLPLYRALYLDKMLEQCEGVYVNRDQHFKSLVKNFKTVGDSDYEVPESLRNVLRNYQAYGFKWLRTLEDSGFGGILADDMGLGKTLQVVSVLLSAKEEGRRGTALVVAPASLVYNWQEELHRFAPQLTVCAIAGGQKERREVLQHYRDWDVLVTSYDLLKRDIGEYRDCAFRYQILDEAQYIKNYSTAAAKSVKVINSRVRYALTGTPIENRLSELWSIFDYLMPGFLYDQETFRREIEVPASRDQDQEAMERLRRMVSPFILRRLKQDVLKDLPDKLEEVTYALMDTDQRRVYDGQVVHMREMLEKQSDENFRRSKIQVLSELTRLRQLCCDPSLLLEGYEGGSAKREACIDLIRSAVEGEHKVLVFSQFTSMLSLLEDDLRAEGIEYYKLTGETPKHTRVELVNAFNRDNVPVFLISLRAGGTGLNLTGADVVIHYDPWWNLAVQNQATDRAHRIGQTRNVSVYKLIAKDTVEEKILAMQDAKKDLAEEILSGETGGFLNMSREELLELIRS